MPSFKSLVCIGDSLVEGEGDERGMGGWVGRLAQKLPAYHEGVEGWKTYNLGIGGDTIRDIDVRLGEALLRNPDILIIGCCPNDISYYKEDDGEHPKLTKYHRQKFWKVVLKKAKAMCPNVLVTPGIHLPADAEGWGPRFAEHTAFMEKLCAEMDIPYCAVPVDFVREDWRWPCWHWNSKGYEALSKLYHDKLTQLGWL